MHSFVKTPETFCGIALPVQLDKYTVLVKYLSCVAPLLSIAVFQTCIFLLNCTYKLLEEFIPLFSLFPHKKSSFAYINSF